MVASPQHILKVQNPQLCITLREALLFHSQGWNLKHQHLYQISRLQRELA